MSVVNDELIGPIEPLPAWLVDERDTLTCARCGEEIKATEDTWFHAAGYADDDPSCPCWHARCIVG